jgi:hypothetical protein
LEDIIHLKCEVKKKERMLYYLVQFPAVAFVAVALPPVAFPAVIFCANAGVAMVIGLIVAAATIPKAATSATAIKKSFEFIILLR